MALLLGIAFDAVKYQSRSAVTIMCTSSDYDIVEAKEVKKKLKKFYSWQLSEIKVHKNLSNDHFSAYTSSPGVKLQCAVKIAKF